MKDLNRDTCMPKVGLRITVVPSHNINAPLQICPEILCWVVLIFMPSLFDECFQFGEEFFDRVEIWGVRGEVHKFDPCINAHLLDSVAVVEGGIVHDEN